MMMTMTKKNLGSLHRTLSPLRPTLCGRYYSTLFTGGGTESHKCYIHCSGPQWQSWDSQSSWCNAEACGLNRLPTRLFSPLKVMREHGAFNKHLTIWLTPLVPSRNFQELPPQFLVFFFNDFVICSTKQAIYENKDWCGPWHHLLPWSSSSHRPFSQWRTLSDQMEPGMLLPSKVPAVFPASIMSKLHFKQPAGR